MTRRKVASQGFPSRSEISRPWLVKRWAKRPGLMTVKLPLTGPDAVTVVRVKELEPSWAGDGWRGRPVLR